MGGLGGFKSTGITFLFLYNRTIVKCKCNMLMLMTYLHHFRWTTWLNEQRSKQQRVLISMTGNLCARYGVFLSRYLCVYLWSLSTGHTCPCPAPQCLTSDSSPVQPVVFTGGHNYSTVASRAAWVEEVCVITSPRCHAPWGGVWWSRLWKPPPSWHCQPSPSACQPSGGCSHWIPGWPGSGLRSREKRNRGQMMDISRGEIQHRYSLCWNPNDNINQCRDGGREQMG